MVLRQKRVPMNLKNRQLGFSLLEIILAIAILSSLVIMIINLLSGQITMRQKITDVTAQEHTIDMALSKVVKDLQGAFLSNSENASGSYMTSKNLPPKFLYKTPNLIFTTMNFVSFLSNSNQSSIAMIRYYTKDVEGKSEQKQLLRVNDTEMIDSLDREGVGVTEVLLDDVEEFKLQFWNGRVFVDDWDSSANETNNKLPRMVKIHIGSYFPQSIVDQQLKSLAGKTFDKKDRKLIVLETIVYLPNTASQDEAIQPDWSEYKWQ